MGIKRGNGKSWGHITVWLTTACQRFAAVIRVKGLMMKRTHTNFFAGVFSRCRAGTEGDESVVPSQRDPGQLNLVGTSLQRENDMGI